jgi:5'-nucleotidase
MDFRLGRVFDFSVAAALTAQIVTRIAADPLPEDTLLNVNVPAGEPTGIEVTHLGKRLYDDEMRLVEEEGDRKRYEIYGFEPSFEDEAGSDLSAIAQGRIALTPVHFDLTDRAGLDRLRGWEFDSMLAAASARRDDAVAAKRSSRR